MKVAIVEDDRAASMDLQGFLCKYGQENGMSFSIETFSDAVSFLSDYKSEYDIVFMDIDLPGLNGMDAAKSLRRVDDKVILIFVTNLSQFAIRGYEVNALDFILKPVRYSSFAMRMKRIAALSATTSKKYIMVPIAYGLMRLSISDIFYVEIRGHKLQFHTVRGLIETRGKLSDYDQALQNYGFLRCNKCYLVNTKHIEEVKEYTVVVAGQNLQISRNRVRGFSLDVKKTLEKKAYAIDFDTESEIDDGNGRGTE